MWRTTPDQVEIKRARLARAVIPAAPCRIEIVRIVPMLRLRELASTMELGAMSLALAGLLALSSSAVVPPSSDARHAPGQAAAATMDTAAERPPTAEEQADRAAYGGWMHTVTHALAGSANPRDRALATQLGSFSLVVDNTEPKPADRAANGALLRAAAEAAPDDALIQWFWAQAEPVDAGCESSHPCPHRDEALVRVEPDNVAAWMPIIGTAWKRKDAGALESALAKAALASRYDDHVGDASKAWMDVFTRYPMPVPIADHEAAKYEAQARAFTMAMALSSAMALPAFDAMARSCHRSWHPTASPVRFRDCAQIGRTMLGHADSQLGRMLGRSMLRLSGQAIPADLAIARAAEWQRQKWSALTGDFADPARLNAWAEDSISAGSEVEAIQVELERAGIPLAPPAGWQPLDSQGKPVDLLGPPSTVAVPADPGP